MLPALENVGHGVSEMNKEKNEMNSNEHREQGRARREEPGGE